MNLLSEHDNQAIDARLGVLFGRLHSHAMNEWFGIPQPIQSSVETCDPDLGCYRWSTTFSLLLDDLLTRVQVDPVGYGLSDFPFEDIRLRLSQAIGSFLFEDAHVPSLVWLTGSECDIYLLLPYETSSAAPSPISQTESITSAQAQTASTQPYSIVFISPTFSHVLWADPLLEPMVHADQSLVFWEGYTAGGGRPLKAHYDHKTKKLWYTLFQSLVVLTKYGPVVEGGEDGWLKHRRDSAKEMISECVKNLKELPIKYY